MSRIEPGVLILLGVILGGGCLLGLLMSYRATASIRGAVFRWHVRRGWMRRRMRFGLMTLLAGVAVFQLSLGFLLWQLDAGHPLWSVVVSLLLLLLGLAFYWCCVRDVTWRTVSARYRSILARGGTVFSGEVGAGRTREPGKLVKRFARPRTRNLPEIVVGRGGVRICR